MFYKMDEKFLNDKIEIIIQKRKNADERERELLDKQYDRLAKTRQNLAQEKFNKRHSTGHLKDL